MKHFTFLLLILSFAIMEANAQSYYNNLYNYEDIQEFDREIHQLENGDMLVLATGSKGDAPSGIIVRKIDEKGVLLSTNYIKNDSLGLYTYYTHNSYEVANQLYIIGTARKGNFPDIEYSWPYFIKYDIKQEKVVHMKFYPIEVSGTINTMTLHNDGYFYAAGYEKILLGYADKDLLLMKIDKAGNLIWKKNYNYGKDNRVFEIEPFGKELILTGTSYDDRTYSFIAKVDTNGNILKKVDPIRFGPNGVIQSEIVHDQIYFTTVTYNEDEYKNEIQYLAQFDANLNVVWDTLIPITSQYNIHFRRMEVLNNEIILAGNILDASEFSGNYFWTYATSWSLDGQFNWEHLYYYDPQFTHYIDDIEAATNGDLIFMGTVFDSVNITDNLVDQSLWLFRTDSQGCGTIQDTCYYTLDEYFGLDTMVNIMEPGFFQTPPVEIFGNPFKEQLILKAERKSLNIIIYNTQGQLTYEGLLNGKQQLNTKNWQSGIYIMQVLDKGKLLGVHKLVRG